MTDDKALEARGLVPVTLIIHTPKGTECVSANLSASTFEAVKLAQLDREFDVL